MILISLFYDIMTALTSPYGTTMIQAHIISGPYSEFALRLIDVRKKADLTQQELADKVGIDKRNISRYENGHARPRGETVRKLATVLDCDSDWLVDGITAEMKQYLAVRYQEQHPIIPKVVPIFIENWTSLQKAAGPQGLPHFCKKPESSWQTSKADLFVHWVATTLGILRATRYPGIYPDNIEFPADSIVIFDSGPVTEQTLLNGCIVIFRIGSQDEPGLRRFVREPGLNQAMLISLNPASPAIPYDRHEVELIGVVVGQVIPRKSLIPIPASAPEAA
jgi:transcriptional regulator with XRE-family HTH domain